MEEHFEIQAKLLDVLYGYYGFKSPFLRTLRQHWGFNFGELLKPMVLLNGDYIGGDNSKKCAISIGGFLRASKFGLRDHLESILSKDGCCYVVMNMRG